MNVDHCPECGNIRQDGRCGRCEANGFARQRHWRIGDRGGKRPERQQTRWRIQDVIDGTWKNERYRIVVHIDTENGTYRSVHGRHKNTSHIYRFQKESDGVIHFFKDDVSITAFVSDLGFLVMQAGEKKMSFACEFDGDLFLTCPICHGKSPLYYSDCRHCDWEFESYL